MDLTTKIKEGSYWGISLKLSFEIIRFGCSIILARILDPKDFGIYSIGFYIFIYANSIKMGFHKSLMQKKDLNDQHINSVFMGDICISILLTILCFSMSGKISNFFSTPESKNIISALSCLFLLHTFYDISIAVLTNYLCFKDMYIILFLEGLLENVVAIVLALSGKGIWSLIYAKIFSTFIITIILLIKSKWIPKLSFHVSAIREIYNFGLWETVRVQLYNLINYSDYFFIGYFMQPTSLGYYEKAFNISIMPQHNINMRITSVLFPSISKIQDDSKLICYYLKKIATYLSLIIFPILFGISFIAPYAITLLYGQKWTPMIIPLQILALSGIFKSITGLLVNINIALGKNKRQSYRDIISGIIFILILGISINFGIIGVAIGVFIHSLIYSILTYHLSLKLLPLNWSELLKSIFPALFISILMYINLYLIGKYFLFEYTILNLFILCFFGFVLYISIFSVVNFKNTKIIKGKVIFNLKAILGRA